MTSLTRLPAWTKVVQIIHEVPNMRTYRVCGSMDHSYRIVNQLVEKGLCKKLYADKRSTYCELTEKGERVRQLIVELEREVWS